jgi:hypothetical protein
MQLPTTLNPTQLDIPETSICLLQQHHKIPSTGLIISHSERCLLKEPAKDPVPLLERVETPLFSLKVAATPEITIHSSQIKALLSLNLFSKIRKTQGFLN